MKHETNKRLGLASLIILMAISSAIAAPLVEVSPLYGPADPGWGTTKFATIQNAIANVDDNGTVQIHAGVYTGAIVIDNRIGVKLIGDSKDTVIHRPTAGQVVDHIYHYNTSRKTACRILNSLDTLIQGVTFDAINIRANNLTIMVIYNSTATVSNCFFTNNQLPDSGGAYAEMAIQIRAGNPPKGTPASNTADPWNPCNPPSVPATQYPPSIYTPDNRAPINILNNEFLNVGRIGVHAHWSVYVVIEGNKIGKSPNSEDFGYGTDLGSWSCGEIRNNIFYGFNTAALSDHSESAGIYFSPSFTNTTVAPLQLNKDWIVEGNECYDNMFGCWMGLSYGSYGGNCDTHVTFRDNYIHDNISGIFVEDTSSARGSSITVESAGNRIENNEQYGVWVATHDEGGSITLSMQNDTITGSQLGFVMADYNTGTPGTFNVSIENCNLGGNAQTINNTVAGSTFQADNNWWGDPSGPPAGSVTGNVSTGSPLSVPSDPDRDGDGLMNWEETENYSTDPDNKDTDGDGYEDGVEIQAGTDPLNKFNFPASPYANSTADTDGDGYMDKYEVAKGTDPTDPDSHPTLGDVNDSGAIDNVDAVRLYAATLGFLDLGLFPLAQCDVNRDGVINNIDAIIIFNYFLGNVLIIPTE